MLSAQLFVCLDALDFPLKYLGIICNCNPLSHRMFKNLRNFFQVVFLKFREKQGMGCMIHVKRTIYSLSASVTSIIFMIWHICALFLRAYTFKKSQSLHTLLSFLRKTLKKNPLVFNFRLFKTTSLSLKKR